MFEETQPIQVFRVPAEFQEPQEKRSPVLTLAWLAAYVAAIAAGLYVLTH
jgi:hypothetical protein